MDLGGGIKTFHTIMVDVTEKGMIAWKGNRGKPKDAKEYLFYL
jgi:hypothetical protein